MRDGKAIGDLLDIRATELTAKVDPELLKTGENPITLEVSARASTGNGIVIIQVLFDASGEGVTIRIEFAAIFGLLEASSEPEQSELNEVVLKRALPELYPYIRMKAIELSSAVGAELSIPLAPPPHVTFEFEKS